MVVWLSPSQSSGCRTPTEQKDSLGICLGGAILPLARDFPACWDPQCQAQRGVRSPQPGRRCLAPLLEPPVPSPLRSGIPMADTAWPKPARQARWSSCRLGCKSSSFLLCSQGLLICFNTLLNRGKEQSAGRAEGSACDARSAHPAAPISTVIH